MYVCTDGRTDGQINGRKEGRKGGKKDGWMDGWMDRCHICMNGWMSKRIVGWINGWGEKKKQQTNKQETKMRISNLDKCR